MSDGPRFEHRTLSSGEHCVISPDVKGLCAVGETEAEAHDGAAALLEQFRRLRLPIRPRADRRKPEAA